MRAFHLPSFTSELSRFDKYDAACVPRVSPAQNVPTEPTSHNFATAIGASNLSADAAFVFDFAMKKGPEGPLSFDAERSRATWDRKSYLVLYHHPLQR